MADDADSSVDNKAEKMFTLKKWNAVAMWSWDVECDICAICRVQVMGESLSIIWLRFIP
ncbi:Roc2 [Drosophila busckii]|uniref:Roc2 n=1 Tax=Drosophila busckii TaxID=30019 RepID=A0A0M3QUR5_DROBS|nr:Roc2 [Drosophila busckii]